MQTLRELDSGGVLADDMGLGKTLQSLAHVLLEKQAGRLDTPALVVMPTSLIPNWLDEAERFAPICACWPCTAPAGAATSPASTSTTWC